MQPAWNLLGLPSDDCQGACGGFRVRGDAIARAIVGVRRLLHTGLAVEIAIRAVGADGVLPDDASQIGTGQIDTRQIGTIEVDAGEGCSTQIGAG